MAGLRVCEPTDDFGPGLAGLRLLRDTNTRGVLRVAAEIRGMLRVPRIGDRGNANLRVVVKIGGTRTSE
jgi:hypothetical protein